MDMVWVLCRHDDPLPGDLWIKRFRGDFLGLVWGTVVPPSRSPEACYALCDKTPPAIKWPAVCVCVLPDV